MAIPARGVPRFLPTLTEVVQVPPVPAVPPPDLAALEAARRRAFAGQIRERVQDGLDARLQEAVAYAMLEQVDRIGERLRRQMDDMVRDALGAITERLRAEVDGLLEHAVDAALAAPEVDPAAEAGMTGADARDTVADGTVIDDGTAEPVGQRLAGPQA